MSENSYCAKVRANYGVNGSSSYPAPGSNGPAQMLYDHHQSYHDRFNDLPVMGSDSWPGSTNPSTAKLVR